ncbi:unnamed protein product [Ambrosiozyma monospora]|uniref:Unnamed protein product n=1 Tax=Ambrosiozyma monospora TaxID=43982 RepID=A0A9W6Z612_AMBMO|nr:unnamed protein product [Ambrosiozyma monospora]
MESETETVTVSDDGMGTNLRLSWSDEMTTPKLPDEYLNIVLGNATVNANANSIGNGDSQGQQSQHPVQPQSQLHSNANTSLNYHCVSGLEKLAETYIITRIHYSSTRQSSTNNKKTNGEQLHTKQQQQQQRQDQFISNEFDGDQDQNQIQNTEGSFSSSATSTLTYLLKDKTSGEQFILNFMPSRTVGCLARCANTYYITSGLNPRKLKSQWNDEITRWW